MPRVCLAISTFQSNASARRLVELARPWVPALFERIFVVDSLGTGALADLAQGPVEYHDAPSNLGSAGNLARRLELAAKAGFDLVFAVNHDGHLTREAVERLVAFAAAHPQRLGAAYPLRRYTSRGHAPDLAGLSAVPLPQRGGARAVEGRPFLEAEWSSSNGALYSLEPVREGVAPMADLWMGWEDLVYGWSLSAAGYAQFIVTDAVLDDDFEYGTAQVGPAKVSLTDKPTWYAYYTTRNLLLALPRVSTPVRVKAGVLARLALEFGLAATLRNHKLTRLRLLAQGVVDGVRGRTGKGQVP